MHPYIIGGIALLPCAAGATVVAPLVQGLLARRTFWPSLYPVYLPSYRACRECRRNGSY